MYLNLIPDHLLKIKEFEEKNNLILVYKGFPNYFLFELNKYYPFISNAKDIFKDGLINLRNIINNKKNIIKYIFQKTSSINLLLYEELLIARSGIDLSLFDGNILIINNNLFEEFPNQSNETFIDIERNIEENDENFDEGNIISKFYSNSTIIKNINYIQYLSINDNEYANLTNIPFFGNDILDVIVDYKSISEKAIPLNTIIFLSSDNSYLEFKKDIFFNSIKNDTIVTDKITLNSTDAYELNIIDYIFRKNDLQLNILIKKTVIERNYRNIFVEILLKYWHSANFRNLTFYLDPDVGKNKIDISQGVIIEEIIQQCENSLNNKDIKDIFLTSSTGSGKSILFQIPAIYLHDKYTYVTIVVSPLKALMYDQVRALNEKGVDFCAYINSDLSFVQRENTINKIINNEISIIYLSPELLLSYDIRTFIGDRIVGLFVIDEAHLVTTWGRDFRVDYWYLGNYIRKLRKYSNYNFPVIALTATAVYSGKNDMVFDTVESLFLQLPIIRIGNVERDDIKFNIREYTYTGNHDTQKLEKTTDIIKGYIDNNEKALVYFPWINQLTTSYKMLDENYRNKSGIYYSYIDKDEKQNSIEQFINNELTVIMATKAFGMGVDISDIKKVYHHAPSGNFSDYIQEIGRVARDPKITGEAEIDFNIKDLKYTKILYGLSSIKQYQIKLALNKINDIYKNKKKQNFLVSAEDFQFIFNDDIKDNETKIKSTLLLLEKDLLKKFKYNIIVVRPKSLFSTVYAEIPNSIKEIFLSKYGNFVENIQHKESQDCIKFNDRYHTELININYGDIYKIKLNDIWEKYYYNESFPKIKRRFFEKELFNEYDSSISPRYRLTITLKFSKDNCLKVIKEYFQIIEIALNRLKGHFFERSDFEKLLKEDINDIICRKRISDLIKNIYTVHDDGTFDNTDSFIVSRRQDGIEKLRVISNKFIKVKHDVIRYYNLIFPNNAICFDKYLPIDGLGTKEYIKIGYILESFVLGNYELAGGQMPQIFIRINDPYRINLLSNDASYNNKILQDVHNRHEYSIEIMKNFFSSTMSDQERWDFIENYFLGG